MNKWSSWSFCDKVEPKCAPVKRDGGGGVPPPFPIKIDGGHRKRGTKSVPLLRCRSSLFCGAPLAGWKRWFSIVYITLRPPTSTTHPTLHRLYTIKYSMAQALCPHGRLPPLVEAGHTLHCTKLAYFNNVLNCHILTNSNTVSVTCMLLDGS